MSMLVGMGANAMCSFGTGPAPIRVTSQQMILAEGKPAATIQDCQPNVNDTYESAGGGSNSSSPGSLNTPALHTCSGRNMDSDTSDGHS